MTNIAWSQDYLRSSLHRHDTIFFSKMSHAADNTACRLEPLAATATTQSNHNSRNQWPPRPWLHGARFAAKIFLQITNYFLKWNLECGYSRTCFKNIWIFQIKISIARPSVSLLTQAWQQPLPWGSRPQIDKSFWNFQSQNPWALDGFSTNFKY